MDFGFFSRFRVKKLRRKTICIKKKTPLTVCIKKALIIKTYIKKLFSQCSILLTLKRRKLGKEALKGDTMGVFTDESYHEQMKLQFLLSLPAWKLQYPVG